MGLLAHPVIRMKQRERLMHLKLSQKKMDWIRLNFGCGVSEVNKISNNNSQNIGFFADYLYSQADYLQLVNYQDSVYRASQFERLAADLCSQHDITPESHEAAIEAILWAAECYVNSFFIIDFI
ncbi:unnamed protein product [Musa acuminata subsp. burmannicoides]